MGQPDLFPLLLLGYFLLVFVNLAVGRRFISELKLQPGNLWEELGSPPSVFAPRVQNLRVYKFIFLPRSRPPVLSERFLFLTGALRWSTLATHLTFAATVVAFLLGAG